MEKILNIAIELIFGALIVGCLYMAVGLIVEFGLWLLIGALVGVGCWLIGRIGFGCLGLDEE